jgi:hypothetical protein
MMRLIGVLIVVLLGQAPVLSAQDTTLNDPVRAERLRQMIEERFGERLKEELGLTPDQATRLRVALAGFAARRRSLEQDERGMRQALAAQLRPGIAANSDSVAHLVDALTEHRVTYAQTFKDEMRDLSAILNPVQRGQYLLLRDRLMQRAADLQQGRNLQLGLPRGARRRP